MLQAVVMGMSASGVIIGILRLITKGALVAEADGLRTSTYIYFACAAAITTACLGLYQFVMPKLDVVQFYRGKLLGQWQKKFL
jgi:equilibrative nucleoside transporter 1/2/3